MVKMVFSKTGASTDRAHRGCPLIKSRMDCPISVPASVKRRHIPNNMENNMARMAPLSKAFVDCESPESVFGSINVGGFDGRKATLSVVSLVGLDPAGIAPSRGSVDVVSPSVRISNEI